MRRLTPYLVDEDFCDAVNVKRIILSPVLKKQRGWRGEALWREGVILLDARDCSRYRTASMYSKPDGKSDMSPTGVAAHEQGHFLWFASHRTIIRPWAELFRSKVEKPITSYAASSLGEDFAETFRLFSTNPGMLSAVAPRRHELLSSIVEEFTRARGLAVSLKPAPHAVARAILRLVH
jgi:hypothetical protein